MTRYRPILPPDWEDKQPNSDCKCKNACICDFNPLFKSIRISTLFAIIIAFFFCLQDMAEEAAILIGAIFVINILFIISMVIVAVRRELDE